MLKKLNIFLSQPVAWGAAVILVAAAVYFTGIEHESIWYDEAYTAMMANYSFGDILRLSVYDNHPPLYYLLSHLAVLLFGKSVWAFRLFSTIGAIAFVSLGAGPIRRLLGNKTGFIFSIVALSTPAILTYAHEARMYSLAILCVTAAALYGFLAVQTGRWSDWLFFGLSSLAAAYLHYYALVAAILMHTIILVWVFARKREHLKSNLITAGCVILLYLPWAVVMFRQIENAGKGFWLPPLSLGGIGEAFIKPFAYKEIYPGILPTMWGVLGLAVALVLFGLVFSRIKNFQSDSTFGIFLLVIYLGTMLVPIIISLVARPMFNSRYALTVLGLFLLLVSIGIGRLPWKYLHWPVLGLFVVLNVFTLKDIYTQYFNYPMKDLAADMKEKIKPGDLIISSDSYSMGPALYYFPEAVHYYSNNSIEAQWGQVLIPLDPYLHDETERDELLSKHQSFWYITANTRVPKNIATILKGQTGWESVSSSKTYAQPYTFVNFSIQKYAHTGREGIAAVNKGSLTLHFSGLNPEGQMLIFLYNTPNIPYSKSSREEAIAITGEEMSYTMDGVYFDDYVIIAFHDENKNHQPDIDKKGLPAEGFSIVNMEKFISAGLDSYPFAESMVSFDQPESTVEVRMVYPPFK